MFGLGCFKFHSKRTSFKILPALTATFTHISTHGFTYTSHAYLVFTRGGGSESAFGLDACNTSPSLHTMVRPLIPRRNRDLPRQRPKKTTGLPPGPLPPTVENAGSLFPPVSIHTPGFPDEVAPQILLG